jgi:nitrite reductase (NO-forming)
MKKISLLFSVFAVLLFLYSCGDAPKEAATDGGPMAQPTVASGKDIYMRNCASCHMAGGDGIANVYPPLAKSDYLSDKNRVITQVMKGSSGEITVNGAKYNGTMPPQQLNDEEIASVLTYVFTSFGNTGGAVTVDEVKAVRSK